MKKLLIAAIALAAVAAASPASAVGTVLDFSGAICTTDPCVSGSVIQTSYGDGVGVDVGYASYFVSSGDLNDPFLRYWDLNYGDLVGVVWGGNNPSEFSSRITLTALPGYEISLLSFDIGTFVGSSPTSPVLIESLGGIDISAASVDTLFPLHNHVTVGSAYFTDGIALNWGPDGFNVGLDNIAFDVRAITTGGVPEPATWAMMILGLGAAGSLIRRRRAALA